MWSLMAACALIGAGTGTPQEKREKPAQTTFPADWQGAWKGDLMQQTPQGMRKLATMELEIKPLDDKKAYAWTITYLDGKNQDVRRYELRPEKPLPNEMDFILDEKNGILLEMRRTGSSFVSQFRVGDRFLSARYERRGDALWYEILAYHAVKPALPAKDDVPEIQSYRVVSVQSATLTRKP